jgi:hypothetical protein
VKRAKRAVLALAIATAAVSAAAATATPAYAQPPDPKTRSDRAYKEGLELARQGNNEAALAKFESAYSLAPTGIAVYQIARMEQALGRHALALQHFREALRDAALTSDMRHEAERSVTELRTKIGVIALDLPEGAAVTVDGNEVEANATVEVVPGLHVVKVRLSSETKSVDVTAPAGVVTPVKVRFGEEPKPPPPAAPSPAPPSPPPEHPSDFWTTGRMVGVSAAGAGIVALGLAVAFQLGASSASDDAESIRSTLPPPRESACSKPSDPAKCADLASKVDDQHSQENVRTAFLVAGGLFLVGGAALFVLSPPKSEPTRGARIVPVASTNGGGLSLTGRF